MNSENLIKLVRETLEDMKGRDVTCLSVSDITTITDYMIVVTGTSSRHIKSMTDEIVKRVKEAGGVINGIEGQGQAEWILLDLGDAIVHLMLEETRKLYDLESLWNMSPGKPVT